MAQGSGKKKGASPFADLAKLRDQLPAAPATPAVAGRKPTLLDKAAAKRAERAREAAQSAGAPMPSAKSEEEIFLAEMAGTAPLGTPQKKSRVRSPANLEAPVRRPSEDAEVVAQLADLVAGEGPFDIADSDEYIEGLADGVDRDILRRLRSGDYAVQAHVDLHGMTREEAQGEVARFLAESRKAGRRCVLIVHGRGLHSKDQIPVLKGALRGWLERGQTSRAVLAFATAKPHDGGAGAVYVLLRR